MENAHENKLICWGQLIALVFLTLPLDNPEHPKPVSDDWGRGL